MSRLARPNPRSWKKEPRRSGRCEGGLGVSEFFCMQLGNATWEAVVALDCGAGQAQLSGANCGLASSEEDAWEECG